MARSDSEQADILDAVVARLVDQVDAVSEKTCFIAITPVPPYFPADNIFVTVSTTAGTFPEDLLVGGGINQCTERTGVLVTIFSRKRTDRAGQDREVLNEETRGLLRLKRAVLKALTGHDLQWQQSNVLRSLLLPTESSPGEPVDAEGNKMTAISIRFSIEFDWNLTV